MKTEQQHDEVVPQTEQQRIEGAIDTALLNADLLREQVAEMEAEKAARQQAVLPEYLHDCHALADRLHEAGWRADADAQYAGVELLRQDLLAAASAPVERVEQELVAEILVDSRGMIVDAVRKPCHLVPGFHKVYTAPQPAAPAQHSDDVAVDRFAAAMKAKLAAARAKGRSGWDDPAACSVEYLAQLLHAHLRKRNAGTFEDVANFCMMLHQRGADPAALSAAPAPDVAGLVEALETCRHWFEQNSPAAPLITGDHATHPMLAMIRKTLAAHQQREGE